MKTRDYVARLAQLIATGKLDKYLDEIIQEVVARRRAIREQAKRRNVLKLGEHGTKVRITGGLRPKYLVGVEGTVVPRPSHYPGTAKGGYIYIDTGRTFGTKRARYGPVIGVPADCLEEA